MTLAIAVNTELVGGPKLISGTETAGTGDTTKDVVLSPYLQNIDNVCYVAIYKAAVVHAIATIDFTTVAGTLTITFANPTADITIYFTVVGR